MIRKYQNELLVLISFLVLLGGFLYQKSMSVLLDKSLDSGRATTRQIQDTKVLQKVWSSKGIKQKVTNLRGLLPPNKVKTFDQKKGKLIADFVSLTSQELNKISTEIASLPVHVEEFNIVRIGDNYEMRCRCSW